jgi:exosortase
MTTTNRFLTDYFRCPQADVEFDCPHGEQTSQGYFRFGEDVVCYARSRDLPLAETTDEQLHDALKDVHFERSRCVLPFDPLQVIENLRLERYAPNPSLTGKGHALRRLMRRAYYRGRPYLPVSVRKHLQRTYLTRRPGTGFPEWPVDRTVDRLLEKLLALSLKAQRKDRVPFIWFWPEGHKSAVIMTHDVEMNAGVRSCSALMDLDERYGIRSSFQLVPESRYAIPRSLLDEIRQRGCEVNIHDLNHDGRLYWTREEFVRRAGRINRYAREFGANGFRAGVLYRNPDWYDALDVSYDMSVPNVGHLAPQTGGCCTVMPYFIGRVLELPLTTTEDYLLFQILGEYSTDLWQLQIQLIQDGHGLISFLTHPDYLDDNRARETYSALLAHLSRLRFEERVWMALPGEVDEWWRARSQMTLVQQDGAWQIRGFRSERARIAYAHLDRDGIRYTIDSGSGETAAGSFSSIYLAESPEVALDDAEASVSEAASVSARGSAASICRAPQSASPKRFELGRHVWFALACIISGLTLWGPLKALASLAYHSDYYSHTVVMPLLAGYLIFIRRRTIFNSSRPSPEMGIPLLAGGSLVFILGRWALPAAGPAVHLSLAILSLALFWMGSFAFCYGRRSFLTALFPLLLLLLMVPLPLATMDDFIQVTRIGSTAVASAIFSVFGVPVFRNGFLFVLPGVSIEVAKECSGIHSTIALFLLTLICAYLFLPSPWRRALLLLFVFPIVSLTNGVRIATLTLVAEYIDENILHSSLHREGGVLFFLLALGIMLGVLRLLALTHTPGHQKVDPPITSRSGDVSIPCGE